MALRLCGDESKMAKDVHQAIKKCVNQKSKTYLKQRCRRILKTNEKR